MYKLLIADDENIIRQGIADTFQKHTDYFEIFQAENGEEVLEVMDRVKIDVLIIDIKMPKINGITVLKKLWETNHTVLTVVLTGYDEFDYAKSALDFGAAKYILKPMVPTQLMELAGELKTILDTRQRRQEELTMLREEFVKNRQLQKEKFFQDLLNGEESVNRMKGRIELLNLKVQGPLYQAAVLGIQHYGMMDGKENNYLIDYSITRYLSEYCEKLSDVEFFQINSSQYIFLFNLTERGNKERIDRLYELKQRLEETFRIVCAAGLGIVCDSPGKIRYSYNSAESTVRYLNMQKFDYVLAADEIRDSLGTEETDFDLDEYILALKSGREEQALGYIGRLFEKAGEDMGAGTRMDRFYISVDQILLSTCQSLLQCGGRMEDLELNEFSAIKKIYQMNSPEEIRKYLEEITGKVCHIILEIKTDGRNNTIRRIEQIVNEEYSRPLSMKYIADQLYINHIYLGQIFKKETGISLNDYINKVRISKAKKLLKVSNSMVYEVAEQVGFSDSQYFSTVFKKIVGVSPKEYKDM